MNEYDIVLDRLKAKRISQWEARKKLFGVSAMGKLFVCPDDSKFAGTIVATRAKRCLDVYWCLGKLISA